MGSLNLREYGYPGMPIFMGCANFYDTGRAGPVGPAMAGPIFWLTRIAHAHELLAPWTLGDVIP